MYKLPFISQRSKLLLSLPKHRIQIFLEKIHEFSVNYCFLQSKSIRQVIQQNQPEILKILIRTQEVGLNKKMFFFVQHPRLVQKPPFIFRFLPANYIGLTISSCILILFGIITTNRIGIVVKNSFSLHIAPAQPCTSCCQICHILALGQLFIFIIFPYIVYLLLDK